jgi:hypothetical protein
MNKIILSLIFILASVSSNADQCQTEIDQLLWLKGADAKLDAKEMLKSGELKYKAVYGYSVYIPGVPSSEYHRSLEVGDHEVIEGTGDDLCSEEHEILNDMAYKYAEVFNKILLGGLSEKKL